LQITELGPFYEKMPKAAKDRLKHSASLSAQLQNDKNPQVSESHRSKRKRKAEKEEASRENGEQVISGKMGRQILTMAREQQEEAKDDEESELEDEMRWRESQM
jgi:hypothetical protein